MAVPLRLELDYRVRFDEAGSDGLLRPSGFLRYAQDLAWRHSDAAGFDRAWYAARGLQWLIRCAELEIVGAVAYGSALGVTTEVVGWRRFWARRRSTFRVAGAAELAASAQIDWVLLNAQGRPTRIPDEIAARISRAAPAFEPAHVKLPEAPPNALLQTWTVRPRDLDPMGHVNNATWLDWVDEALAAAAPRRATPVARRWRLDYLQAAQPGAELRSSCWPTGDGRACRITDSGGVDLLRARAW
jgi:acyl-ACP thioesterase